MADTSTVPKQTYFGPNTKGGYWMVVLPNGAVGVIRQTFTGTANAQAVYLGTNEAAILKNFNAAVDKLEAFGLFEADPGQVARQAVGQGAAIFTHTPSGAVSDPSFTLGAALSAMGLGEFTGLGSLLLGTEGGPSSTVTLGEAGTGAGAAGETTGAGASGVIDGTTTGEGTTAEGTTAEGATGEGTTAEDPTAADETAAEEDLANNSLEAAKIAKIWEWVTTPAKWLEILKFIAGAVLIYIGLRSMIGGDQTTVTLPPSTSSKRQAAG